MPLSRKRQQSREEATGTQKIRQIEDDPSIISIHGASITVIALTPQAQSLSRDIAFGQSGLAAMVEANVPVHIEGAGQFRRGL
jgi:hypothetical protein